MKKYILLISIMLFITCKNSQEVKEVIVVPEPIIVYDTIPKKLNKGERLLAEARQKLRAQKESEVEIPKSDSQKLAALLLKYQNETDLSEKEIEGFLMIDPKVLRNSAELSEMYNEALFKVINNNNSLFAKQLVRQPAISEKLAFELSNPVNDQIEKDLILEKTRKEYEIQVDNRINEIEDERLIMQYYTEKKKVFRELEGDETTINTPQKVKRIDENRVNKFELEYKIENRIPDSGMGFLPTTFPSGTIRLDNNSFDLNKYQQNIKANENLNQGTIRKLKKSQELKFREGGG